MRACTLSNCGRPPFRASFIASMVTAFGISGAKRQTEPGLCAMLLTAALLSCVAVLWASWYLAALGYAFRYLQNVQHSIERDLGWAAYGPTRGKPPARIRWPSDVFWLLPSIYHAHVFALVLFLAIIISTCAFYWYSRQCWGSSSALCIGIISLVSWVIGVAIIIVINVLYVLKFKRKKPASVTVLDD